MKSVVKLVFWVFQILFTVIFVVAILEYVGPSIDKSSLPEFELNVPLALLYVIIQSFLWFAYNIADKKEDAGELLFRIVAIDMIIGLAGAVLYSAMVGTGTSDWLDVLNKALTLTVYIVTFGNAPTVVAYIYFGAEVPKRKKPSTHIVDKE